MSVKAETEHTIRVHSGHQTMTANFTDGVGPVRLEFEDNGSSKRFVISRGDLVEFFRELDKRTKGSDVDQYR